MKPGERNLITDVPGLRVGHAQDARLKSGTTVLTGDRPFTAAVQVIGGAPGTRETDLLAPENLVPAVDALVLSGGSAFGLAAADGVAAGLRAAGRGFEAAGHRVPIVPAAILFDLAAGGTHDWTQSPYQPLGRQALDTAGPDFDLGSVGAGTGATTAGVKGGLGSASAVLADGTTLGALVAVNAVGSAVHPGTGQFWAAPFERGGEYGDRGAPKDDGGGFPATKLTEGTNTTIAIVATDATLTKAQARRMAMAAHDGMARALLPSHTPFDGDLVFAAATGTRPAPDPAGELRLGHAAACCLARAIARGVHAATSAEGDVLPTWAESWG
ncbi:D-aminopeptidase [Tranquillimonas rosea]|uniref:D-aminopeptidase n=1 Tax=Tranquillimonas rosea TaxID=641238 RepID=A0A1H9SGH1_9RHOB|nr:P1 family peptidase [Tranquillimonas rosea]SER83319.1 D-aminopeptidase [Tranquillimonas rosea]